MNQCICGMIHCETCGNQVSKTKKLLSMVDKAYEYLKEGKAKFTPGTTNSHVDVWLKDYETMKNEPKQL